MTEYCLEKLELSLFKSWGLDLILTVEVFKAAYICVSLAQSTIVESGLVLLDCGSLCVIGVKLRVFLRNLVDLFEPFREAQHHQVFMLLQSSLLLQCSRTVVFDLSSELVVDDVCLELVEDQLPS